MAVSTGISELDQRLGGLVDGRYYLLTGTPGAGKTSACLHFIAEGLRAGESCAILTQENPDDLFTQAQFIGYDFHAAAESEALVVLQYRLDFSSNFARVGNSRAVARELVSLLGQNRPRRLVVDSILPFIQAGGVSHGAATALLHVMEELRPTAYFTVPGDLGDSFYARLYDPLVSGSAGLLHFEMHQGDVRQVSIRKIRQTPVSTEPMRFIIRGGLGIVELSDAPGVGTVEIGKRVALINAGGRLGGELYASLERSYELDSYDSIAAATPKIPGDYAIVLIAVDPLEAEAAIAYVRSIRRQSGIPVVMVAQQEGLRAVTRTRALRAGADEFLSTDGSAHEFLNRVESARARGPRDVVTRLRRERLLVQPRDQNGRPMALPELEIVRAVRHHLATSDHPFFALVRLRPPGAAGDLAWDMLSRGLRLGDGDLVAQGAGSEELVLYLHDISRRHARELLDRIFAADPRLDGMDVQIEHYPVDSARIEDWLETTGAQEEVRVGR